MKKEYNVPRVKFCRLTASLGYAATGGDLQGSAEGYGRVNGDAGGSFWGD